ncbi:hypothetical protein MYOV011v1_p0388 [Vibrio phage 6E35.1a]|nr:hypothetical protein MYOV011v1_p0388 [Vibrio phage 6E35.1a]
MRIVKLEEQMKELQSEIDKERSKCAHTRVTYKMTASDGDPFSRDTYYNTVRCIDCKTVHRFCSDDDIMNYHMRGEIGSAYAIEESKYKVYLEVLAAINGTPVPPYPY